MSRFLEVCHGRKYPRFDIFDALGLGNLGALRVGDVENVGYLRALGIDFRERDLKVQVLERVREPEQ
jgi:hypothetical protein